MESCVATWLSCLPGYLDVNSTGEHLPCETRHYAVAVKKSLQMTGHIPHKIFEVFNNRTFKMWGAKYSTT